MRCCRQSYFIVSHMTLKQGEKIEEVDDKIGNFNGRHDYTLNALLLSLYKATQLGLVTRTTA